jgi:hypothetical protein
MIRIFLLSVAFFGFFAPAYSNSVLPFDVSALSILEESKDPAILGIEDENVYLNAEKVVVREDGIFLSTRENILLRLLFLSANASGLYTKTQDSGINVATVWPLFIKCKNCGFEFIPSIFNLGECPKCHWKN